MNKVTLTKEEAQWFSRNVLKMLSLLESQGQKDATILNRTTYKTLNSMKANAESIAEPFTDSMHVFLTRKQKLIVRELIQSVNKTLVDRILPEYERRGGHEKYIEMGKTKSAALDKMARKFR